MCRHDGCRDDIQCPFYRRDDGRNRLSCEGMVDGSTLNQNFASRKDLRQQMEIFCCGKYENCEIYRMLMENKY